MPPTDAPESDGMEKVREAQSAVENILDGLGFGSAAPVDSPIWQALEDRQREIVTLINAAVAAERAEERRDGHVANCRCEVKGNKYQFGEVAREDFDDPRCLAFWEGKS